MASGYSYGYDTTYATYAGYAAAQMNIMQQQKQQPQQSATGYSAVPQYQQQQTSQVTQSKDQTAASQTTTAIPAQSAYTYSTQVGYPQGVYQAYQTTPTAYQGYVPSSTQSSNTTYNQDQSQTAKTTAASAYRAYQSAYSTQTATASYPSYTYTQSSSTSSTTFSVSTANQKPQNQYVGYQSSTGYSQSVQYPSTSSYQQQYAVPTSSVSGTSGGTSYPNEMTPQQQYVVQQFVQQKVRQGNSAMKNFVKKQPKYQSQEEFYCEVCKIACGSPFAYKAHMAGKNHKKRVQQVERTKTTQDSNNPFKCDICDIFCSNHDAFQSHLKGGKHLKTVNLFRKLGKPLPVMTTSVNLEEGGVKITAPRVTFIGGKKLNSTGLTINDSQIGAQVYPAGAPEPVVEEKTTSLELEEGVTADYDVQPVGESLVKPVSGDPRNPHATFLCELCDCFFCDEFAKLIHCKGRRHRLNYKKQYQPDLVVEPPKSQVRQLEKKKKQREEMKRSLKQSSPNQGGRGRGGRSWRQFSGGYRRDVPPMHEFIPPGWGWVEDPYIPPRNPMDDRVITSKHDQLRPEPTEIQAILSTIQTVEKSLKAVSDELLIDKSKQLAQANGEEIRYVTLCYAGLNVKLATYIDSDLDAVKEESNRQLKGVMRVGLQARSLVMRGNLHLELIVMCDDKPTLQLLEEIYERLPSQLAKLNPDQIFNLSLEARKAGMTLASSLEGHPVTTSIVLTSTAMREESTPESIEADLKAGVLDRQSCLASLAALRHTKWFQAMCQGLPSFNCIMRIFMDLSQRNPVWRVLDHWMLELLVQKCISSANPDFMKYGDIFRRVIECIASGLFLPGGPGLKDPCEKGDVDAAGGLNAQERADLTLIAQHYLRLIAYNQLHLVLDVTPPDNYAPYSLGKHVPVEADQEEPENEDEDETGELAEKKIKTEL